MSGKGFVVNNFSFNTWDLGRFVLQSAGGPNVDDVLHHPPAVEIGTL